MIAVLALKVVECVAFGGGYYLNSEKRIQTLWYH